MLLLFWDNLKCDKLGIKHISKLCIFQAVEQYDKLSLRVSLLSVIWIWYEETNKLIGETWLIYPLNCTLQIFKKVYYVISTDSYTWNTILLSWYLLFGYISEIADILAYFKFSLKIFSI